MSGNIVFIIVALLSAAGVFGPSVWRAWRVWRNARGVRLVACPETAQAAAVSIDAGHAAFTAFIEGAATVRLASCSRWDTRGRCDEPCVGEVQRNGRAAAVHAIATRWYEGKDCVLCGRPIPAPGLFDHHPALLGDDGVTSEWSDLEPEELPALFEMRQPVCWDCHVAERFRREFPELAIERPAHR